ncbi:SIMPL domain-containing protein [Winogradskyella aurantia]|uniref:SIMPL domain-containing protein n=1 Tax=Winogradskyella aurantia TaxID=1915063 RepID=A0A265UVJ5_9FLAO|nr:SIMPL domain-containing protein [Winogradskyella aurantia]OZV69097.1 SIMPL domain-containing protein [Winogradskyella aurantia]
MKNNLNAILFSLAIVTAAYILGNAVINRNNPEGVISVTGLGTTDFTSDLIVWEGFFTTEAYDLKKAYDNLKSSKDVIADYLETKGVANEELVFNAVTSQKNQRSKYTSDGKYVGDEFLGYTLTQTLKIESKNVEDIERISREITELLNKGINFYSRPPRYYYTKLADLKIEMISKATADAYARAEKIAENSGSKLGDLKTAKMGIFQITGQNSSEDYSWGGTFNTSSKKKTANITMKLIYKID